MTDPADLAQKVLGAVAAFVKALPAGQLEDLAAPLARLRAYCSCPGESAMMNLRFAVAK